MEFDLLHPDPSIEMQKHKLKKLVQKPNSFFLDIALVKFKLSEK